MKTSGVYLPKADLERQIYIKCETVLADVGHFHDSIEFIFLLEGSIEAHRNAERTVISAGEIFFADSFVCHYYRKLTPEIKAIVLVLSREYTAVFKEMYRGKTFPPFMKHAQKNAEIFAFMEQWVQEEEKTYLCNYGYCNLLFSKIEKNYSLPNFEEGNEKGVTMQLLKYISDHFQEDISLQAVAKAVGYSKEYCSKIFKESIGLHFREYLNYIRIKKANEYFSAQEYTHLTTLEIIYRCGFNSSATFYRAKKALQDKNNNF